MALAPLLTTCALDCQDRCSIVCTPQPGRHPGEPAAGPETCRLRGDPFHPFTRGFTCAKIRRYPARLTSPERIVQPQVRVGRSFSAVTWGEAFEVIIPALEQSLRADPASVLYLRSGGAEGITKSYGDYLFGGLGARTTTGSLCDAAGTAAVEADTGALRMNHPRQIELAEAIVLWGKHPRASAIHVAAQVVEARRRGVPVLAINPDTAAVAGMADRVIRVRPGSDRFLALAVTKLLLQNSSRPVPWQRAANASAFLALLDDQSLPGLLAECDVTEADARSLAAVYARTPRVATVVGWGLQRYLTGGETVRALHALAFLAGTLGVPGGGFYFNVPSSRHLRAVPPPAWPHPDVPGESTPAPALQVALLGREMMSARPPIRFAWVMCANPLNQVPDAQAVRRAFAAIPTRVVVEAFWTDTAREATVVLPPVLWLEEDDVTASPWHSWLGVIRKAFEPPPGCRSDFQILQDVGAHLGFPTEYRTPDAWLAARLPAGGPTPQQLRREGSVEIPEPEVAWSEGFAHPDGLLRLLDKLTPEPAADPARPLRLLSTVRRQALHSQMLPAEQEAVLEARIHPDTARAFGLEDGDAAVVESAVGGLHVVVRLDPGLHPGVVACPRDGWVSLGLGPNAAHVAAVADLGGQAAYYSTEVTIRRAAPYT